MPRIRLKVGFKSRKQADRLQSISLSQIRRHSVFSIDHDHGSLCRGEFSDEANVDLCAREEVVDVDGNSQLSETWREGQRVVELGVLADGLSACIRCGLPLSLSNTVNIVTRGLAAFLKVRCTNTLCCETNCIPTGKKHGQVFDVNTKLATALVHAGLGVSQINAVLTAINIPMVSHTMLDRREMGQAVENVADMSVEEALEEERKMSTGTYENSEVTVSVDAGWQKRGSGKSYDSLSGHCSMIGNECGKIVGYSVRTKSCRVCQLSSSNKNPRDHNCRKNWTGSAKAMEPDMVLEMVRKARAAGCNVGTVVGDDDTTTIARLRGNVDPGIKKRSDSNHIRKALGNTLFALQNQHTSLTTRVIKYIQKCFNYMVAQNKGNPDGIAEGLKALSQHPFGNHEFCNARWCRFVNNSKTKFQSLPYGKPLTDKLLQAALSEIFQRYSKHCHKLCSLGSTQANESFNKTFASKAPKTHHYSGSSSLNYRVAASVAQKNVGYKYLMAVNKKLGLSPGEHTRRLSILKDIQTKKRRALANTKEEKLRRLQLKAIRFKKKTSHETRKGISYSSNIDLDPASSNSDMVENIPPPIIHPVQVPVQPDLLDSASDVFFDLESTGLARISHITQIAAARGSEKFCCYVMPKIPTASKASEITGIKICNQQMFHHDKPVAAFSLKEALSQFNDFLGKRKSNVLVGHNIQSYDCPLLMNAMVSCDSPIAQEVCRQITGFVDSRKLFKITHPELKSFSQQALVKSIMNETYKAHDALEDVIALQKLVAYVPFDKKAREKASFTTDYVRDCFFYSSEVKRNLPSLNPMIEDKVLSKGMAKRIAGSGLSCRHLQLVYQGEGRMGVENIFTETIGKSKVRVTRSKLILARVSEYLSKISKK